MKNIKDLIDYAAGCMFIAVGIIFSIGILFFIAKAVLLMWHAIF